jgi:SAM-dependent methyltransferase
MVEEDGSERNVSIDAVQAGEYAFPYHYIPDGTGYLKFCKYWKFSPSYIAAINLFKRWLASVIKRDNGKPHKHIDYGCGDGGFLYAVNSNQKFAGVQFEGVDVDGRAIKWAENFAGKFPNLKYSCGNIDALPEEYFDSGSLIEVFEHIPPGECEAFLLAISRSLKVGAPLYVTVPSTEIPLGYKHYRHFNFESIKACFSDRFEVVDCFGFERTGVADRLLKWLMMGKRHYIEVSFVSTYIVRRFERRFSSVNGCGRIGLVLKNMPHLKAS